jgi:hypothetical protein
VARLSRLVLDILIVLFRLRLVLLLVAVLLAITYFWVDIDPSHEYGFGGGVLHGFFGIQNTILFCFTDREVWAPLNTGRGYTAGFSVGLFVLPFLTRNLIRAIIYMMKN